MGLLRVVATANPLTATALTASAVTATTLNLATLAAAAITPPKINPTVHATLATSSHPPPVAVAAPIVDVATLIPTGCASNLATAADAPATVPATALTADALHVPTLTPR